MIIKELQKENAYLRQNNKELQDALEEKISNIDAKKLLLVRPKEW